MLDRADTVPTVLAAAERLAGLGLGGWVQTLVLGPAPAASFPPSEEMLTAERLAEDDAVAGRPDRSAPPSKPSRAAAALK